MTENHPEPVRSGKPETPDELLTAIRNAQLTIGIEEEGSAEWHSAVWDLTTRLAALDFLLTQKEPLPADWQRPAVRPASTEAQT